MITGKVALAVLILAASVLRRAGAESWPHLGYDDKNFACDLYPVLCNNFLDLTSCPATARAVVGCAGASLESYVGSCSCTDPQYRVFAADSIITNELIDNRIKPELKWILEPWSNPPYDPVVSFKAICGLLLARLGCAMPSRVNDVSHSGTYSCTCGDFSGTSRVQALIANRIGEATLMQHPIFADPLVLSTGLSIAVFMLTGPYKD